MTAELIRWRGGPGAGKSSALLDYCQDEVKAGATIQDLALMTFSRPQATDLARRLQESVFPTVDAKKIRSQVATIDAHALRACRAAGLISDPHTQILSHPPDDPKKAAVYRGFMKTHDLEYDPSIGADTNQDRDSAELPIGNMLIALKAYLAATMRSPEEWRTAAEALGIPVPGYAWPITALLKAWGDYKGALGVFEHADYVHLALERDLPPPAQVLIIDEYQDVSPLQAALIKQWIHHPDTHRVYVAGDEDQSIYGFRGCDPRLFLSLPAEDRGARADGTRPTSYRCPVQVMQTAEMILGHPANVSPCDRRGRVAHFRPADAEGLARQVENAVEHARTLQGEKQPVFILSRFRRGSDALARALSNAGIPCSSIKPGRVNFWTAARVGRSWENLEKEKVNLWTLKKALSRYLSAPDTDTIPQGEAEALILSTLTGEERDTAFNDLKIKTRDGPIRLYDIHGWLRGTLRGSIFDMLNLRPRIVRQIQACLSRERRRGYEISPEQVKIDTIHASKGMEAAVVLLHTGYLKGRLEDLTIPETMAEERRVYFVGATRASHALLVTDFGSGPTCPLLAGVVP